MFKPVPILRCLLAMRVWSGLILTVLVSALAGCSSLEQKGLTSFLAATNEKKTEHSTSTTQGEKTKNTEEESVPSVQNNSESAEMLDESPDSQPDSFLAVLGVNQAHQGDYKGVELELRCDSDSEHPVLVAGDFVGSPEDFICDQPSLRIELELLESIDDGSSLIVNGPRHIVVEQVLADGSVATESMTTQFECPTEYVEITSAAQLELLAIDRCRRYRLAEDLSNIALVEPIGDTYHPFLGVFDGQGKQISGLSVVSPDARPASLLFEIASTATVKNLKISEIELSGEGTHAGLSIFNSGLIENIELNGVEIEFANDNGRAGGLVYQNSGHIKQATIRSLNITSLAGLASIRRVGGVARSNKGLIEDSRVEASSLNGSHEVGGFVGLNSGEIYRSSFQGYVAGWNGSGVSSLIGGFVGWMYGGIISDSFVSGQVKADTPPSPPYCQPESACWNRGGFAGGLTGGEIRNSYMNANLGQLPCQQEPIYRCGNGFLGLFDSDAAVVSNSFFINDEHQSSAMYPSYYTAAGTPISNSEGTELSTFESVGWDFQEIWQWSEQQWPSLQ